MTEPALDLPDESPMETVVAGISDALAIFRQAAEAAVAGLAALRPVPSFTLPAGASTPLVAQAGADVQRLALPPASPPRIEPLAASVVPSSRPGEIPASPVATVSQTAALAPAMAVTPSAEPIRPVAEDAVPDTRLSAFAPVPLRSEVAALPAAATYVAGVHIAHHRHRSEHHRHAAATPAADVAGMLPAAAPSAPMRDVEPRASHPVAPIAGVPAAPPGTAARAADGPALRDPPAAVPDQHGPTEGDVFLDGARVGRWMATNLARAANRPAGGSSFHDPRMGAVFPGSLQGG